MINEVKQALGSWDLKLSQATPRGLLDAITPFGHLAIIPGRVDPAQYGDNLLTAARYVGVYRKRDAQDEYTLYGASMAFWLGDEDNKGDVFEWDNRVVAASAEFADTVRLLLPEHGAVTEGTFYAVPGSGTYSGTHVWQTPRTAISYVCDIFSTEAQPVEWRANGDGSLDAGPIDQLYVVDTPRVLLTKKPGRDLFHVGLPVRGRLGTDVEDYSTRVVVLGEGLGGSIALGTADAATVPYKDIHGNEVRLTRMVSSAATDGSNTAVVAQLQLGLFTNPKYTVDLSTSSYDIHGDAALGDYVMVYDPDNGFTDPDREIYWEGQPINPIALRCVEMSWPVTAGYTVAFRDHNGVWWDLTDYYVPEDGETRLVVGEYNRSVAGIRTEPLGTRPIGDSSVPGTPAFTGFSAGVYQSGETNTTKSAIRAQWDEPLNTNGSTVLDGDHYEIRYRVSAVVGYQVDWDLLSGYETLLSEGFDTDFTDSWPTSWDRAGGTVSEYQVTGGKAYHTPASVNSSRSSSRTDITPADVRIVGKVSTDQTAADGAINGGLVVRRAADGSSHLRGTLIFQTDGSLSLRLSRLGGAGSSDLSTATLPWTYSPDQEFWLAIEAVGTAIKAMAWPADEPPPSAWQIEVTETSITAGHVGTRSILFSGNTNTGASIIYDDITVTSLVPSGGYSWDDLGAWDGLISEPVEADPQWQTQVVGWGTESVTIIELTPGVTYEIQIRAVDSATPPNFSAWSGSEFVTTTGDLIAPSTPSAPGTSPNIIASSRIAIQLTHYLGKNSGGLFNLEQDLDHINVHVGGSESFFCDETNKVGELIATAGMLQANIPAVGTCQVEQTDSIYVKVVAVDRAGNKSEASPASQATALLIDDAHISDLTVSKVTAGTITAQWLMAGTIKTADSGRRVTLESDGINLFNDEGASTIQMHGDDGIIEFFEEIPGSGGSKWAASVLRLGSQVGPGDDVYGLEVRDIAGSTKALIGKLRPSDEFDGDNYGIALQNALGQLVKLSDICFGPTGDAHSGTMFGGSALSSTSYQDITDGPSVDVTVGETGRAIVMIGCSWLWNSNPGGFDGIAAYLTLGSTAPDGTVNGTPSGDTYAYAVGLRNASGSDFWSGSKVLFLDGLDQGSWEFFLRARVNGGSAFCSSGHILVFPF